MYEYHNVQLSSSPSKRSRQLNALAQEGFELITMDVWGNAALRRVKVAGQAPSAVNPLPLGGVVAMVVVIGIGLLFFLLAGLS